MSNICKPVRKHVTVPRSYVGKRHDLLKHARELIENNPRFLYAFADFNCSLAVKDDNNKYHYFNSKGDLAKILN